MTPPTSETPAAAALLRQLDPILTTDDSYPRLLEHWAKLEAALYAKHRAKGGPAVTEAYRLAQWLGNNLVRALPGIAAALHQITDRPTPSTGPFCLLLDEDRCPQGFLRVEFGDGSGLTASPPPYGPLTVTDLGTGEPFDLADAYDQDHPPAPLASWWPRVPDALAEFYSWTDCPDAELERTFYDHPLPGLYWLHAFADTYSTLTGRAAGYTEIAERAPDTDQGNNVRGQVKAISASYADHAHRWAPLGDQLVTDFRTEYETAWSALAALLTDTPITGKDLDMPALLATPAAISTLAQQIRAALDAGHGGRLNVAPDAEQAFAWAGTPRTLLSHLATGLASTRRFTVAIARDSADAIAPVAEGGLKPNLVDFTSEDLDMLKFAGSATLSVESAQFVSNIEQATTTVMIGRILRAIEAEAADEIVADAGVEITAAADITAGVVAAIAGIASNGGTATVVGLSAADWIDIFTATGGNGYINFSTPEAGPGSWLGLTPVLVPGLPANTSVVLDGTGVTVTEIGGGPLCIVDPFTEAKNNKINIYLETWAKPVVTSPGIVASVVTVATP